MASSLGALGASSSLASAVTEMVASTGATGSVHASASAIATQIAQTGSSQDDQSVVAAVGHLLYLIVRIIPGFLLWLAGFTAWTLPAWLFKTTSWSLTFTMNATTLCVGSLSSSLPLTGG